MAKKRVYEVARELDMKSKELLEYTQILGMEFSSHMASMTEEEINHVQKELAGNDTKESDSDQVQEEFSPDKKEQDETRAPSSEKEEPAEPAAVNEKQQAEPAKAAPVQNKKKKKKSKKKKRKFDQRNIKDQTQVAQGKKKEVNADMLEYRDGMTIAEIAESIDRDPADLVKQLFMLGVMANQNQSLDTDTIEILADELGIEAVQAEAEIDLDSTDPADPVGFQSFLEENKENAELAERPPVVTIMGHVDHGKTTLLDTLRDARVTAGEAGGITQHIGAYQLESQGKKITFLDTPGHAAFTTMRARGADVTDIAIIVVAADDGVKPQTEEAINHAKAAGVPIIVAINKIDKPTANSDRVKQELMNYELIPEEWGGDTITVEISALMGQNLDELLEMVLLVAEVQELTAPPEGRPLGSVIEARLDKSRGPVATILVQEGTLRVGDPIVVGYTHGRIRTMTDDLGNDITEAGPSKPVEITGLNDTPEAGDNFVVFDDEKTARAIGRKRAEKQQVESRRKTSSMSLETLFENIRDEELKEVALVVKADVRGSVEALASSLQKIEVEGVKVNIIHTGVGAINETDVTLSAASNAIIIGFSVRPNAQASALAEQEGVSIQTYNVIYDAIDDVESAMKGLLDPEYKEQVIGLVQVREVYKVTKVGTIAGCYVTQGRITRSSGVRLIRNGVVIYEGELASLKRFNDDVREVTNGYECGLMIENYNDIKVDDEIEAYEMVEIVQ